MWGRLHSALHNNKFSSGAHGDRSLAMRAGSRLCSWTTQKYRRSTGTAVKPGGSRRVRGCLWGKRCEGDWWSPSTFEIIKRYCFRRNSTMWDLFADDCRHSDSSGSLLDWHSQQKGSGQRGLGKRLLHFFKTFKSTPALLWASSNPLIVTKLVARWTGVVGTA